MSSRPTVLFQFREDVPRKRQDELLREIRGWSDVCAAHHLSPKAKREDVFRMCFVELETGANAPAARDRLAEIPEVAEANVPAARRLT